MRESVNHKRQQQIHSRKINLFAGCTFQLLLIWLVSSEIALGSHFRVSFRACCTVGKIVFWWKIEWIEWFNERFGTKSFDARQWGAEKLSVVQTQRKTTTAWITCFLGKLKWIKGTSDARSPARTYSHLKRFSDEKSKENFAHMLTNPMHKHAINYI